MESFGSWSGRLDNVGKAVCHPSVLAIGEAGLDRLGPADILLQKRCLSDKFY